jgi:hypothetical protein
MVTPKNVINRPDPDSLHAQALEGEQRQLISVVKSLFPYGNAISNILFRARMITASLDKARIEYATDDDSSRFRFSPNLVNKQHHRRYHRHHHPLQSKAPVDHALGFRTVTRAAPPTKKKDKKTTASTTNKIDTQRNSKPNRRLSDAITTSHNKEHHHDKAKNKGIKRLRSPPSNRSRSAGGKRKSSHSSNTSSKRPLISFPNVALQFQKAIMQKMIQQKRLRRGSTSALFNIFSSITEQGEISEKIVNLELQYTADPPRIFKALGYVAAIATTTSSSAATAAAATTKTIQSIPIDKIPIALAPASASINLHSIARRTILPFLNIQQPSKEDTPRADENETIFEDTAISKERQQQYVQPIRSTPDATVQKPAASRRKLDVQKKSLRRQFKMSADRIHTQAEKFTRQKSVPRKRYTIVDSESQVLTLKSQHHHVMKIPGRLGSAIAGFFGGPHIMRNIRTSSQILSSPLTIAISTTATIANSSANSFEPLFKRGFLPLQTLMASLPSVAAVVGGREATALDRAADDASTGARLLPPFFLHKALFRNVATSIEKISTRMPMQQQIASGVKGQAKEELDIEISQDPKQARVDMVTGQAIERLYDGYGKENIQSAAAAYTALRSRVNQPLHFPFQLMSSTSIVRESIKRVFAANIRSAFPTIKLPSAVKDRFDVQKITINPYYVREMQGALKSTTPIRFSSFSEPAAKNASQPDRYLSHSYAKKEQDITRYESENTNSESKEQQLLVNPVTRLQREYSKYILHNAIYKAGKDQSILLTAAPPSHQSKPLLSTTKTTTGMRERQADVRKSSSSHYANMAKLDNSSINLPVVSQLQVMLANQYADNSDHHINSLALLPQRQILSSLIPQAFVAQKLGTSFGSTAGKQVSTISTNETKGKLLNERSSSTLMHESTESRFGQDNGSNRSATKIEQEDTNKGLSLRQLRKMMEQIFHEELKRYGL